LFQKLHQNFCSGFPSRSLVDFILCTHHGGLSEQFSGSQAAFGTTLKVTGGPWKPEQAWKQAETFFIYFTAAKIRKKPSTLMQKVPI
jgi:hypothetical protein